VEEPWVSTVAGASRQEGEMTGVADGREMVEKREEITTFGR
jgi:hypothetical protein